MLALHIYNNKSKQSLSKFFFITFSLSTELLEDKQRFKLGGVDTSPTYLLFQTLLPLFWTLTCMIWMELTRTDAVFSRTAMVLFLCRNKKFSESPENQRRIISENIKNTCKKIHTEGPRAVLEGGRRAPLPRGPPDAPPTYPHVIYIPFRGEINQLKNYRVLRDGAAAKP